MIVMNDIDILSSDEIDRRRHLHGQDGDGADRLPATTASVGGGFRRSARVLEPLTSYRPAQLVAEA